MVPPVATAAADEDDDGTAACFVEHAAMAGHEIASAELPSESLDKLRTEPMQAASALLVVAFGDGFAMPDGPGMADDGKYVAVCGWACDERTAIAAEPRCCTAGLADSDDNDVVSIVGADRLLHALMVVARLRCSGICEEAFVDVAFVVCVSEAL